MTPIPLTNLIQLSTFCHSGFSVTIVGKAEVNWYKDESTSHRSGDTVTIERYTGTEIDHTS